MRSESLMTGAGPKDRRRNKLSLLLAAVAGALRRGPPLAVLALRRVGRLALHPAATAKMNNLLLRGLLGANSPVACHVLASTILDQLGSTRFDGNHLGHAGKSYS
jgi:hypothetical protein